MFIIRLVVHNRGFNKAFIMMIVHWGIVLDMILEINQKVTVNKLKMSLYSTG